MRYTHKHDYMRAITNLPCLCEQYNNPGYIINGNIPLSFKMASLTTLSQPVQHMRTFSSTVCETKSKETIVTCECRVTLYNSKMPIS